MVSRIGRLIALLLALVVTEGFAPDTARAQLGAYPPTPSDAFGSPTISAPPPAAMEPYMDLNTYLSQDAYPANGPGFWTWQILPQGLIYRPYLAGPKESRFAGQVIYEQDDDWLWEATLGNQVGLLRWGSQDPFFPVGFQLDAEGSAQARLDIDEEVDVRSVDFRGGLPLTFGYGQHRTKFGYYHLSSHLGDEFLLKHPAYDRLNYSRDVLILGHAIYLTPKDRVYGEAGWAFYSDVAKEWEFQFGYEHAPAGPTTIHGEPFFAAHGHLREELDFGGGLSVETGWAWRGLTGHMLRTGVLYYNGKSTQYSFYDQHEQSVGFAVWYDH